MAEWRSLPHTPLGTSFTTPPPVAGEAVNSTAVWFWAFSALISVEAIYAALGIRHPSPWSAARTYFCLNSLFFYWDTRLIRGSGNNPRKWEGWQWWGLFITPVYLFVRAAKLKQNCAYAVVWIVCFLISLVY
jgi:hypothetical protein